MSLKLRRPSLLSFKLLSRAHSLFYAPNLLCVGDNCAVVDIPKVASSFIKFSLISEGYSLCGAGPNYPHSSVLRRPLRSQLNDLDLILCFWKDPIDRFCSTLRQKLPGQASNQWSPLALPVPGTFFYDLSQADRIVEICVNTPLSLLDKHLLPQTCFYSQYINLANFEIKNVSHLSSVLTELGLKSSSFPRESIALKTDASSFNASSLSTDSITALREFYADDYICKPI